MIAICIESSNKRGMGHLFRSFLYVDYLKRNKIDYIYLINNDKASLEQLKQRGIDYIIIDFSDTVSNWEKDIIRKYNVDAWLNDKFITYLQMAKHICDEGIPLYMIDESGNADVYADVHFAGMIYPTKPDAKGKEVLSGPDYIILNKDIDKHRHQRKKLERILVTLGGSDPFNVTAEVVTELLKYDYDVDVLIGPNYRFRDELEEIIKGRFKIFQNVKSLIAMFDNYSIAITGGGITCCEANACGLPCLIIANADHEVNTGNYIESLGSSVYLGSHGEWNKDMIKKIPDMDIEKMSKRGMELFNTDAIDKIFNKIFEKSDKK